MTSHIERIRYHIIASHRTLYGLAFAIVLGIAGLLRLGWWGVGSFASDEARLSWLALRMMRDGDFITSGITSSAGARNLPASVYAFLPPYAISPDPLIATLFVGLLNLLAVIGVWWLMKRIAHTWDIGARHADWVALGAMLYVATNPFAVFFSRNIWTQNLLFPLALALLLLLWWARHAPPQRRFGALIGASAVAGIGFQIHLAGVALLGVWVWGAMSGRWWRPRRDALGVVIGASLALMTLAPFLIASLTDSPHYLRDYTEALGQGERRFDAQALGYGLRIAIGYDWNYLALGDTGTIGEDSALLAGAMGLVLMIGLLMGLGRYATQKASRWALTLVACLILTPILVFTPHSTPPRLHYLLAILAGVPCLIGLAWATPRRLVRAIVIPLTLMICALWAWQGIVSLARIDGQTAPNGMGTTLQSVRDTTLSALADIPPERTLIAHTQSDDIEGRGEPAIWAVLAWERLQAGYLRIVHGWHTLILPADEASLFTDADGMPAWEEAVFWADSVGIDSHTFNPINGAPPIYRMDFPADERILPDVYAVLDAPIAFETGLTLVGWQTRTISGRYRVSMVYRVVDDVPPDAGTVQQFTHLRAPDNPGGAPDFISDIPLGASNWRDGDWLISMADFFLPADFSPDAWHLDIGHYRLQDGRRFTRSDDAGDFIRLPATSDDAGR